MSQRAHERVIVSPFGIKPEIPLHLHGDSESNIQARFGYRIHQAEVSRGIARSIEPKEGIGTGSRGNDRLAQRRDPLKSSAPSERVEIPNSLGMEVPYRIESHCFITRGASGVSLGRSHEVQRGVS